jgi:hypothetical protein
MHLLTQVIRLVLHQTPQTACRKALRQHVQALHSAPKQLEEADRHQHALLQNQEDLRLSQV